MARKKRKTPGKSGAGTMASRADIHALYEASVQNVEYEVEFLQEAFSELRGRAPVSLREDFCGTANAACRWVDVDPRHQAVGVDINPEVLKWGRDHHLAKLKPAARRRVRLLEADVRTVETDPADIVVAFNFSYWYFKQRKVLLDYFRSVRQGLAEDGVFFIDVFGGAGAYEESREKTKNEGFTYVWEQASYEPISGDYVCYIHFRFPDGSKIKRAFSYHWRFWTLPELIDLLDEAGFAKTQVFWEGTDEDGEGSGEYAAAKEGENDPAWIAYVAALR